MVLPEINPLGGRLKVRKGSAVGFDGRSRGLLRVIVGEASKSPDQAEAIADAHADPPYFVLNRFLRNAENRPNCGNCDLLSCGGPCPASDSHPVSDTPFRKSWNPRR